MATMVLFDIVIGFMEFLTVWNGKDTMSRISRKRISAKSDFVSLSG